MPSCLLDAQAARLQVQIVMHENEIVRGESVLSEKTFERRARHVHEIERARQFDQLGAVANGRSLNRSAPDKTTRPSCRGPFHNPDAGVVTGLGIGRARVAQSYDEAQRYFFFSASFFSAFGAAAAGRLLSSLPLWLQHRLPEQRRLHREQRRLPLLRPLPCP